MEHVVGKGPFPGRTVNKLTTLEHFCTSFVNLSFYRVSRRRQYNYLLHRVYSSLPAGAGCCAVDQQAIRRVARSILYWTSEQICRTNRYEYPARHPLVSPPQQNHAIPADTRRRHCASFDRRRLSRRFAVEVRAPATAAEYRGWKTGNRTFRITVLFLGSRDSYTRCAGRRAARRG